VYLILAPWFDDIRVNMGEGKTIRITAKNLDVASGSVFVQSLKVNGQQWDKSWVTHNDLTVGNATLEFVLGATHVEWDTGELPPSPGHLVLNI
jgi:putative alpha-1,2-mannosidase